MKLARLVLSVPEIARREADLTQSAADSYGEFYSVAEASCGLFSDCVNEIADDHIQFAVFHSLARKHLFLGLLSSVRQHHNQTMMNLRHAYEAGVAACYAIAHRDDEIDTDDELRKYYKWFAEQASDLSKAIRGHKNVFSTYAAHAAFVGGGRVVEFKSGPELLTSFFDRDSESQSARDLVDVASAALSILTGYSQLTRASRSISFDRSVWPQRLIELYDRHSQTMRLRPDAANAEPSGSDG